MKICLSPRPPKILCRTSERQSHWSLMYTVQHVFVHETKVYFFQEKSFSAWDWSSSLTATLCGGWRQKKDLARYSYTERKLGSTSTRVPGHAFLAWRSSWRMVVYIYYITSAGKPISSHLGSSCHGNRYGTEKSGGMAHPSCIKSHLPGHSPPANQVGRRVGTALYSLRPHCSYVKNFVYIH